MLAIEMAQKSAAKRVQMDADNAAKEAACCEEYEKDSAGAVEKMLREVLTHVDRVASEGQRTWTFTLQGGLIPDSYAEEAHELITDSLRADGFDVSSDKMGRHDLITVKW